MCNYQTRQLFGSFTSQAIYVNLKIDGARNFRIKRFNQAFSKTNVEKITFSILQLVCNRFKFCVIRKNKSIAFSCSWLKTLHNKILIN